MTRFELKCMMAATIAAGYRANPGDAEADNGMDIQRGTLAEWAARDADVVMLQVEQRCTADDNNAPWIEPVK